MIYCESLKRILAEMRSTIQFKHEPGDLKKIQQYSEAFEELELANNNSPTDNPDVLEIASFNGKIVSFLNLLILKYKNKGISELNLSQNLLVIGSVYAILGKCYSNGLLGVKKDCNRAVEYLVKSAACKSPMGTFELARFYDKIDPEHACQLYRVSYKLGYIRGLHKYSIMLIRGNTYVEKNIMDGYYILKQAVMMDSKVFIGHYYDLGMLYKSGVCDMFNDHRYALDIFIAGARKGCRYCQYKLGEEWEAGGIVVKNVETAFYWYRHSALNSLVDGQYKVAALLFGIKNTSRIDLEGELKIKANTDGKVVLLAMRGKEKMYRFTELEMAVHKRKSNFEKFYKIEDQSNFDKNSFDKSQSFCYANRNVSNGKTFNSLIGNSNVNDGVVPIYNLESSVTTYSAVNLNTNPPATFDRIKEAYKMAYQAATGGKKEAVLLVAEALEKGFGTEKNIIESIWWYKIADSIGCENVREKMNILESQVSRNAMVKEPVMMAHDLKK
ncbi:MAG: sel1 repeat family protein [Rickettsiaceae bacterium]|nr:sel1 repeat family protein [Rickettsiaceae bacterium]